jgi:hypothetical protein
MTQFIGYAIDGYDTDKNVPIATGATREECMGKTVQRVLVLGALDGSVAVQERDDIPADTFAQLTVLVDDYFARQGLAKAAVDATRDVLGDEAAADVEARQRATGLRP